VRHRRINCSNNDKDAIRDRNKLLWCSYSLASSQFFSSTESAKICTSKSQFILFGKIPEICSTCESSQLMKQSPSKKIIPDISSQIMIGENIAFKRTAIERKN
jgi:hypothetical protein